MEGRSPRCCIVVLGDFGRSPRMQYHAMSLLQSGWMVDVIAYGGSKEIPLLVNNPRVKIHPIPQAPSLLLNLLPRPLQVGLKAATLFISLFVALFLFVPRPDFILMQNPPAVPATAVCWLAKVLRRTKFVIDWHNLGSTILEVGYKSRSPKGSVSDSGRKIIDLYRYLERTFGAKADGHLSVTAALKDFLEKEWGFTNVTVFRDRPPVIFNRLTWPEKHDVFHRLRATLEPATLPASFWGGQEGGSWGEGVSPFGKDVGGGMVEMQPERPMVVVSSTSWTPDEDFSLLLDALVLYDKEAARRQTALRTRRAARMGSSVGDHSLPRLFVVVTGRGPLREAFLKKIEKLSLENVGVCSAWLEAPDYPLVLACADLGVSLHSSSSGLDLPMKVVDMFGAGVPVLARGFQCIGELVKHEQNGLVFSDGVELSVQLMELAGSWRIAASVGMDLDAAAAAAGGPGATVGRLAALTKGVVEGEALRWEENWESTVGGFLERLFTIVMR